MSEFEPPAPGWWKASDGNWYAPESHPDYVPPSGDAAPPPPPSPAPPASGLAREAAAGAQTKPWWRKWWVLTIGAVVALLVAAGIAGGNSDDPDADRQVTSTSDDTSSSDRSSVDEDAEPAQDEDEPAEPTAGPTAAPTEDSGQPSADEPETGTVDNPLAYDAVVPITFSAFGDADGSVWNVRVAPPRDITADVLEANQFNDEPPDGVLFVGFDVAMTLVSANKEPLSPGFNFTWELLGGPSSAVYSETTIEDLVGCGVVPDEFDPFAEVFVAGTLTGTVCIPLPVEDLDAPGTFVAMNFSGDRIVFSPDGARPAPAEVGQPGEAPTIAELRYGAEVPVTFASFGDADGSMWNVTIGTPSDVESAILAANPFNDPSPDGVTFVGFEVSMTLASAGKEPLAPAFNFTWEVLGGATASVYDQSTLSDLFGCGVVPDGFDDFAEVFVGGTVTGMVCIPVPTEDLDHPDTKVAMNFGGERTTFSADGATPAPVTIEPAAGPAGIGDSLPLAVPIELEWDALGDADGSTWATTVSNWRDMTSEVVAENPFNDPPPDGVVFAGFDVEMTLIDAVEQPLSTGFNFSWEVLGGDTFRVYDESTLSESFGCGVTPDAFDAFAEVFEGGTLSGTVCIPLPVSDFDNADTRIALDFSGDRVTFTPVE